MAQELSTVAQKWLTARESTYNTDEIDLANNLAVARIYACVDPSSSITPNVEMLERNCTRPSFGTVRGVAVRRNLGVSVSGHVNAANNPGSSGGEYPYDMSDFMVAAGMSETIVASTSATYSPTTTVSSGLTAYRWARFLDEYKWQLIYATGVRGNFQLSAEAGQIATWQFDGESANFPLDSTAPADPHGYSLDLAYFDSDGTIALDRDGNAIAYTGAESIHDPNPMYFEGGTVTIDSTSYEVTSVEINHNNQINARRVGTSSPVVDKVLLTSRGVAVDLGLAVTGAGFEKAVNKCLGNSVVSGTLVFTDRLGTGGSTLTITCPKLQYGWPTPSEADQLRSWTLPMMATGDWGSAQIGDNEISYAWTVTA